MWMSVCPHRGKDMTLQCLPSPGHFDLSCICSLDVRHDAMKRNRGGTKFIFGVQDKQADVESDRRVNTSTRWRRVSYVGHSVIRR